MVIIKAESATEKIIQIVWRKMRKKMQHFKSVFKNDAEEEWLLKTLILFIEYAVLL